MLHVGTPGNTPRRIDKIEPLLDLLLQCFRELYHPSQYISMDETMVGFRGCFGSLQYMPQKPTKRFPSIQFRPFVSVYIQCHGLIMLHHFIYSYLVLEISLSYGLCLDYSSFLCPFSLCLYLCLYPSLPHSVSLSSVLSP